MATQKRGERPARARDAEIGTVTLTNTKQYPFNDSERTVALARERDDQEYFVQTEIVKADGEAGDVLVFGKAVNGFKLSFTGSAKKVDIRYLVTGGF